MSQESALDPLLYNLYVSDLEDMKLKGADYSYAVDTGLLYEGKDPVLIQANIVSDINLLEN